MPPIGRSVHLQLEGHPLQTAILIINEKTGVNSPGCVKNQESDSPSNATGNIFQTVLTQIYVI
jgi:hypothetical protein